jgi:glycosyltransferase involved in cell wall biosynthesis
VTTGTILHLTTNDFGGAGKAAVRIHQALLGRRFDSVMLVQNKKTSVENVFLTKTSKLVKKTKKLYKALNRRVKYDEKYCMYSVDDISPTNIIEEINSLEVTPSVIIFHWVAGFISLKDIESLKTTFHCEIYWYAMDMSPFTGGCHFSWGCEEYKNDCKECPAAITLLQKSTPQKYFLQKKQSLLFASLNIISPNEWVKKQIEQSSLKFNKIHSCYLPVNATTFLPRDKKKSNEFKIFFGAQNISDTRKGINYFVDAMQKLRIMLESLGNDDQFPTVVLPGTQKSGLDEQLPFKVTRVPYAHTEEELSDMYQSADVFVCTSVEDSGPMMVCESLMSGVPVIGFEMGICPELIKDGYNGYLVELKNSAKLANVLLNYIKKSVEQRNELSQNARKSVESLMSYEAHTDKLLNILSRGTTNSPLVR